VVVGLYQPLADDGARSYLTVTCHGEAPSDHALSSAVASEDKEERTGGGRTQCAPVTSNRAIRARARQCALGRPIRSSSTSRRLGLLENSQLRSHSGKQPFRVGFNPFGQLRTLWV